MPKPISWSNRAYDIRERVKRSRLETWRRQDIEAIFEIKRASAQNLMKVIGEIHTIGGTHFLERSSLLTFLEEVIQADRVADVVRSRQLIAEPVPNKQRLKRLKVPLPEALKSLMVHLKNLLWVRVGTVIATAVAQTTMTTSSARLCR